MNPKISKTLPNWICAAELQELLGLKNTSLWRLRQRGDVRYAKVGGKIFYDLQSVEDMLKKKASDNSAP